MGLSLEGQTKSGSCWESNEIQQSQPGYVAGRVFASILYLLVFFAHAFINVLWFVHRHECLSIQVNLHDGLFLGIEPEGKLIQAWCNSNDAGLTLFPKEIIGACVQSLDFPRHKAVRSFDLSALPDPTTNCVLGTEGFIH